MDLRCPNRKFAELVIPAENAGEIEVLCASRWCGRTEGVVVLHTFSIMTGELLRTRLYRQPRKAG